MTSKMKDGANGRWEAQPILKAMKEQSDAAYKAGYIAGYAGALEDSNKRSRVMIFGKITQLRQRRNPNRYEIIIEPDDALGGYQYRIRRGTDWVKAAGGKTFEAAMEAASKYLSSEPARRGTRYLDWQQRNKPDIAAYLAMCANHGWHIDLSDADLSGMDLVGAVIDNANLTNTNFAGADLRGAVLRGKMSGTNFANANLSGLDLCDADFVDVSFTGADLRGCNCRFSTFSRCNFTGANVDGASFEGADTTFSIGLSLDEEGQS